jgi:hypothetical protein
MCTIEETEQHQASDDGMPEAPAGLAYRKGTKVQHTRIKTTREPLNPWTGALLGVRTRPLRGEVIGYDDDLLLPVVEWEDHSGPEACEAREFEVVT